MAFSTQQSYQFNTPYPAPEYDYPTAHRRTPSANDIRSENPLTAMGGGKHKEMERASSPTPSEAIEMNQSFFPKRLPTKEFYKQPKTLLWIFVGVFLTILTVLITVYHKQIEDWLRKPAEWVKDLHFGWLIPIAILFIISFPPLFGHEIVAVLCGNVWGLWIGFAIVSAGTLLGEIGNFYAFKYICQARGDKLERDNWAYACLARCVRRGGFKIAVVARLSAIPGHFTTAIFATCGMNIIVFIIAAILSMPKQFITVYLGVLLEQSGDPNAPQDPKSKAISISVSVVTGLITFIAGWYIYMKMKEERLGVVRDRRARLGYKNARMGFQGSAGGWGGQKEGRQPLVMGANPNDSNASLASHDVFNPNASELEMRTPLREGFGGGRASGQFELAAPAPQRWDAHGRAIMDEEAGHGAGRYDDPYAYNAYPPQPSASFGVPPPPRGGGVSPFADHAYPSTAQQQSLTDRQASSPPPSFRTVAPNQQPESPFEDSNAVPHFPFDAPQQPMAPNDMPRYRLTDGPSPPSQHRNEPTDGSFYSAHSRLNSSE